MNSITVKRFALVPERLRREGKGSGQPRHRQSGEPVNQNALSGAVDDKNSNVPSLILYSRPKTDLGQLWPQNRNSWYTGRCSKRVTHANV